MFRPKTATGFFWALLTLALHVCAFAPGTAAQGTRKDDIVFNSRGMPLAGVTVRICVMPATGQPCTPLALIYSDLALTQALANPTTTDGLGNYFFYASPGKYMIEISGPSITTRQIPNVILPSDPTAPSFSSVSSTGGISAFSLNLGGNLTVNGNTTVLGSLASGTLNLTNQGVPPGTASTGTVNLYTKTDKRLYYKDDGGIEVGPIANTTGAQTNITNTWTAQQNFDANLAFKGPNPWIDVTRYGVRAVNQGAIPSTTATISSSSATATLAGTSTFQNGDGIRFSGAGAAISMATPSAPTVTPSGSAGGYGVVVNGLAGSTTYNYQVVACDKNQGCTAASPVGITTTGDAALGIRTVNITSHSRTNNTVTVVTSSAHGMAVGEVVYIAGTSPNDTSFHGMFIVASVADNTHFTYNSGMDTRAGASTLATGGTAQWYVANRVTWTAVTGAFRYFIYGRTGASLTLIGQARPLETFWDDYGSPFMDGTTFPDWVAATPPGAATNQALVTTIVSGAGTTTVTLAASAANSATSQSFKFDNAPNIKAAAVAATTAGAAGTLYFPTVSASNVLYPTNSYLDLSSGLGGAQLTIWLAGSIQPFDSIQIPSNTTINGALSGSHMANPSFGWKPAEAISGQANPVLYASNANTINLNGLSLSSSSGNQGTVIILDTVTNFSSDYVSYVSGTGTSDNNGIDVMIRGDFSFRFFKNTFSGGSTAATGSTLVPAVYMRKRVQDNTGGGNAAFQTCWFVARGVQMDWTGATGGINWNKFIDIQTQSMRNPLLMLTGAGFSGGNYLQTITPADFATPMVANWTSQSGLILKDWTQPTGLMNFVTGNVVYGLVVEGNGGTNLGQNRDVIQATNSNFMSIPTYSSTSSTNSAAASSVFEMRQPVHFPAQHTLYWDLPTPAGVTATVAAGGSVPQPNTWTYKVTAVGQSGGESAPSAVSSGCTTSSGNQTCNVGWTASAGAASYNVYRSNGGGYSRVNLGTHLTTTSYSDTFSFGQGNGMPDTAGAGLVEIGPDTNGTYQVIAPAVNWSGEKVSASPRAEQNVFLPGALTSTWTGATWTLDKAITVTRVQVQAKTAPAGCTTNAIARLTDGTAPVNVTVSAAANDSGAIAQNYAAGASLSVAVQTAAAGCTTSPADTNVVVQYRMQ